MKIRFTKRAIEAIDPPTTGREYHYDANQPNLALSVTAAGTKTFFRCGRIEGRPQRVRIGTFPDLSVEQARRIVRRMSGDIAEGKNPYAELQAKKHEETLGTLFGWWLQHAKERKRTWRSDEWQFNKYLACWKGRRLSSIRKRDVQALHSKIGRESGHYQANRVLSLLAAMYAKAENVGYAGDNPCKGVQKFREEERERFLQPDEWPRFLEALQAEPDPFPDYFLLAVLTGARKGNLLTMQWSDIGQDGVWKIPAKSAKAGRSIMVPLVPLAREIIQARHDARVNGCPWVFPGPGKDGHLVEVRKAWLRICKRAKLEDLRIHDLRRTLGSLMAAAGASLPIIGKALGHTQPRTTMIYSRLNVDPVREAMEKATGAILAVGNEPEDQPHDA